MQLKTRIAYNNISLTALAALVLFGVWWFTPDHVASNFNGIYHVFDVVLFLILSYIIWHPFMMEVLAWGIASNIKQPRHLDPLPGLKVAFVTTFVPQSESIALLERSLPAMVAADYPHDTWVLDEGNDPRVAELCRTLGVYHHSRNGNDYYNAEHGKFARKTKGGNHNSWYDVVGNNYDVVAQLDTDFVPKRSFLTKTLGYFRDPKVAFVGTPQVYGNTRESFIAKGAAQQTFNFYGPILRGLYGMDTTLLIGANHVVRVEALKEVDHYSAHITEDLLTGMKLHAKGWKSVYVHEALAIGEGPTSWRAYFDQQMRWAYGCIDVFFRYSPKLLWKMNLRRKLYYFFLQQHYFSGLAMMLGVLGLALYAFFGFTVANVDWITFGVLYIVALMVSGAMSIWLQRFNVRPKIEKGLFIPGKIMSIAAWPIFFMALIGAIRGKRLTYKVTPKGDEKSTREPLVPLAIFKTHIIIGLICLASLIYAYFNDRQSPVMIGWMLVSALLLLMLPFVVVAYSSRRLAKKRSAELLSALHRQYKFYELNNVDRGWLPDSVTDKEKYSYVHRRHLLMLIFSVVSFTTGTISMYFFLAANTWLLPLLPYFILTTVYFLASLVVNLFSKGFDFKLHKEIVKNWTPYTYPSIDIFLPVAGEPTAVLRNTWAGVVEVVNHYRGPVIVYCLDDGDSSDVRRLAEEFDFEYIVRPDRAQFKKAGNLMHGFGVSKGDFIAIFDADFRPRFDFLDELLPYFYFYPGTGIVQSPQYFDVSNEQGWLERGAGAVQELFYKYAQVSKQTYDASICVGSNAVYSRAALNDSGGIELIDHSEDVHTGFNVRMHGWKLTYVPVIVAKGLCPANMTAFFKQQYRWCLGSVSLMLSKKFWRTKLSLKARLSYFSGFLFYIHTAISSIIVPLIPLLVLIFYPEQITWENHLLLLPSLVFVYVVFPFWHNSTYGMEAWSVRIVYGWAHLFAMLDSMKGNAMQWKPTGSTMDRDERYLSFRIVQIVLNLVPAILWVSISLQKVVSGQSPFDFVPILVEGVYYLLISAKVALYTEKSIKAMQKNAFTERKLRLTSMRAPDTAYNNFNILQKTH